MKTNRSILPRAGAAVGALFLLVTLRAQPAPAAPEKSAEIPKEETVVLSPFEVSAEKDEGYAARETLAGTRFKSDLKDVPSQVSVMTKEFLDDIASVTLEDAYRYSANVENTMEFTSATNAGADFNVGVLNTRTSSRIRGLSNPGITQDFFQTNILQDSYNTERLSVSSGPNAILFGNGNPGGIVDNSKIRPNLQRARYEVSFRTDNYGTVRGAFDLNQPIVKEKFGVRLASTKMHQEMWRKPGSRDEDRYFITAALRPLKTTSIRAYYEDAMIDMTTPRNVRFGDSVTPWINAGRPAFNNGLVNPTALNASTAGLFVRNNSTRNVFVVGAAAPGTPYTIWGSANTANIALATTRYSVNTIGPGSAPLQSGVDSYIYSLPRDETISPFDVSVNGNGTRNLMYGLTWGASIEQRLPANMFFEFDYNHERIRNPISDFIRGISSAVFADANLYLPDRVTPNPNFGRYYVEGDPRVFGFRSDAQDMRAMLSYELDLSKRNGWLKWLGAHRAAAMYQRSESLSQQQESVQRIIPPGVAASTVLDNWGGAAYNTFRVRAYLSDPADPRTGHTYYLQLPFDPVRTTTYPLPDGSTYVAGYKNPYGGTGSANLVDNLTEGQMAALQSFFLHKRLVTTFGWRNDKIRQATYVTQRKTAAPNAAFESVFDLGIPRDWSSWTHGTTNTQGAVLHVFPWLSAFYNQSSTWNPPTGLVNPDDGAQVPGATGKGKDYGLMTRLFDNRVSLRLNKYENTSGPASNDTYRNAIIPVVQNIEQTLIDRTEDGTVNVPRPKYYDAEQGTYTLSGLHSDLVSKGYEFELTANPLRNLRLTINGAKSIATASNIGRPWINFINERAPIWAANTSLSGPGGTNTTIGTRYLSIIQVLNQMKQADGQKVESGREWRLNLVTRYSFIEGWARGGFVGTGFRFRSPQVLGYLAANVPNEFPLPGSPAQVLVPSRSSPVKGETVKEAEAFLGYSRRLGQRVNWRVQLNIRNLFDDRDPMTQRANISTGLVTVYAVPEPRSFILTNTFTF